MSCEIWTQRQCAQTKNIWEILLGAGQSLVSHTSSGNARTFLLQLDLDQNNLLLDLSLKVRFSQPASLAHISKTFWVLKKKAFQNTIFNTCTLVKRRD